MFRYDPNLERLTLQGGCPKGPANEPVRLADSGPNQ